MPTSFRIALLGLAFAATCMSLQARPPAPSPTLVDRPEARHDSRLVDARLEVDGISIPVRIDEDAFSAATRTRPGIEIRELIVKTHLDHAPDTSRLIDAVRSHHGRADALLLLAGPGNEPPQRYRLRQLAVQDPGRASATETVEHISFTFQRIERTGPPGRRHGLSPVR